MSSVFTGIPKIDFMLVHAASSVRLLDKQDSGGRPIYADTLIDVPCYYESAIVKHEDRNGNTIITRATIYFNGDLTWTIRSLIVFGGIQYSVAVVNPVYSPGDATKPHHWEIHCK